MIVNLTFALWNRKKSMNTASETVIIAPEQGMLIQTSNLGAGFDSNPEEVVLPC